MTVFLRAFALATETPETLPRELKRNGIDAVISEVPEGAVVVDRTTVHSPAEFQQRVAAAVEHGINEAVAMGTQHVVLVTTGWTDWDAAYLRAHESGLRAGFTSAPPRPIDRSYVSPLGNVIPA